MKPARITVVLLLLSASSFATARTENWPCFRGPGRQGISSETNLPVQWSTNSPNVQWKTTLPGEAWSSPVVWNNCVYLTTATEEGQSCRVLCLDRDTGSILWNVEPFRQVTKHKEGRNSYATPTPVVDGSRVYAVFGDGSFATLDLKGGILWTNRAFPHYSQHGLGASPILHEGVLIMPRDGSSEGPDKTVGWQSPWDQAFIIALDAATGKVRWKASRGLSRIAHVSPNLIEIHGKTELISSAGDVIQGFDPSTGQRLWTARSEGEGVVASVVVGEGIVFTASGFPAKMMRAYRAGGQGDVTETHRVWEQRRGTPEIASAILVPPYLYTATMAGTAACLDAATGKVLWEQRVGGSQSASPICADGHLYFASEKGEITVIKPGPKFELVARNDMGDAIQASIAVSDQKLFVRTAQHLYAIAK